MQSLQTGAILQGGRYRIEKTLGQGGFGITYQAVQSGLDRTVAIKEFFMKELCDRNEQTNRITLGTDGSREIVGKFKEKFLKEARNIAKLNHPNIVHIFDVFEENDTAYYVMEYVSGGSLESRLKNNERFTEAEAKRYILHVAEALKYVHSKRMNHLDVKPANIILNEKEEPVLIDFGLSKQYDTNTGHQTSSTPVGISEGYAPIEQYKQSGIETFTPETDIYALGATFFALLAGHRPPSSSDVVEDGIPVDELLSKGISKSTVDVVSKAMEGLKKNRIKDIQTFIAMANGKTVSEETQYIAPEPKPEPKPEPQPTPKPTVNVPVVVEDDEEEEPRRFSPLKIAFIVAACIIATGIGIVVTILLLNKPSRSSLEFDQSDNSETTTETTANTDNESAVVASDVANDNTTRSNTTSENTDNFNPDDYYWMSDRLVTESDISTLEAWQITVLRNYIYARNGYIFTDPDWKDYFSQFSWYEPSYTDVSDQFNNTEQQNILFLKQYE